MVRYLTGHGIGQDHIEIEVMDEPGASGANHEYEICQGGPGDRRTHLSFQNGPIAEAGVNGVTQEALIAICIDRLRGFEAGEYHCRENALALTKLEEALHWLHHRTRGRMQRGVEGTSTP